MTGVASRPMIESSCVTPSELGELNTLLAPAMEGVFSYLNDPSLPDQMEIGTESTHWFDVRRKKSQYRARFALAPSKVHDKVEGVQEEEFLAIANDLHPAFDVLPDVFRYDPRSLAYIALTSIGAQGFHSMHRDSFHFPSTIHSLGLGIVPRTFYLEDTTGKRIGVEHNPGEVVTMCSKAVKVDAKSAELQTRGSVRHVTLRHGVEGNISSPSFSLVLVLHK